MRPVADFIEPYRRASAASIDPFARNKRLADRTNDLDPETAADFHMEAEAFCREMANQGERFDLAYFDPPYSPRQISECYRKIGLAVGRKETQNAALYRRVRDAIDAVMLPGGVVLSFGWSTNGMGKVRGYSLERVLMVAHGGAHSDTICIAERRLP